MHREPKPSYYSRRALHGYCQSRPSLKIKAIIALTMYCTIDLCIAYHEPQYFNIGIRDSIL